MTPDDSFLTSLVLFLGVGVLSNVGLRVLLMVLEMRGKSSTLGTNDLYEIAYLRKGPNECIRVAVVALTERGLLSFRGSNIQANVSSEGVSNPFEQHVLDKYKIELDASSLDDDGLRTQAEALYDASLKEKGMLSDEAILKQRRRCAYVIGGILVPFVYMLPRDSLVAWLLVVIAVLAMKLPLQKRWTALGRHVIRELADQKYSLFENRYRISQSRNGDVATLAAIFGIAAVPASVFPEMKHILPIPLLKPIDSTYLREERDDDSENGRASD